MGQIPHGNAHVPWPEESRHSQNKLNTLLKGDASHRVSELHGLDREVSGYPYQNTTSEYHWQNTRIPGYQQQRSRYRLPSRGRDRPQGSTGELPYGTVFTTVFTWCSRYSIWYCPPCRNFQTGIFHLGRQYHKYHLADNHRSIMSMTLILSSGLDLNMR